MLTTKEIVRSLIINKQRTVLVKMGFLVLAIILLFRLYNLQIVNGSNLAADELGQRPELDERFPPRGDIFIKDNIGRSNRLAVTNLSTPLVYVVPKEIENPSIILSALESLVEIDEVKKEDLLRRMSNKKSSYVKIADRLTEEKTTEIREANLQGVYIRYEPVRSYFDGKSAAQVTGYFGYYGDSQRGLYGVEGYFDDELTGKPGVSKALPLLGIDEQKVYSPGEDIYLTIDRSIQFNVERELEKVAQQYEADAGSVLVMDPKTGAIIAMANYPFFDPNNYREVENISIFKNDTISDIYEPGSVFKPITMGIGLDSGAITPTTTYNDLGSVKIGEDVISNVSREGRGTQTMTNVLEKSLNTGTVFALNEIGVKQFISYLERFSIDDRTGIALQGEEYGNLRNIVKNSPEVNFATASFGQGISMTPLRLITALSAFANDGKMMQPYIVEKRIDSNGNVIKTEPKVLATPVSEFTATRLTEMLVSTVENGYGDRVLLPGYNVAAKTGTAQTANEDGPGYSDKFFIHSFVAYAPAYDPKFIILLRLDKPKTQNFAINTLSPTFRNIALHILQYYGVPTDK